MLILVKDIGLLAFKAYTTLSTILLAILEREDNFCVFSSSEKNIHLFSSHSMHIFILYLMK
jgi:hypothetical protein